MLLSEETYIELGRQKGIAEAVSDLAKHQGLTIEQACEMCGYDDAKTIQILGDIAAEAARIAAKAKKKELKGKSIKSLPEYERLTALLQPYHWKEAPTPEEQANAFVVLQSAQPLLLAILAKKKVVGMSIYPQSRYYNHLHEFKEAVEVQNWNEACRTLKDMIRSYSSDTKVFYNTHIILKERLLCQRTTTTV